MTSKVVSIFGRDVLYEQSPAAQCHEVSKGLFTIRFEVRYAGARVTARATLLARGTDHVLDNVELPIDFDYRAIAQMECAAKEIAEEMLDLAQQPAY